MKPKSFKKLLKSVDEAIKIRKEKTLMSNSFKERLREILWKLEPYRDFGGQFRVEEALSEILKLVRVCIPDAENPIVFSEEPTSTEIGRSNYISGKNACRSQFLKNIGEES